MSFKFGLMAAVCGMLLMVGSSADATILVNENFNRADGSLTGTAPTPGPGGVWTDHSGTTGDLLISSGAAVVQHGVPSEDTHTSFAGHSSGVTSATFDIIVNDDVAPIGGTDFEYFAHFMEEGSFNFNARLSVVAPNDDNDGDYTLGIATFSSTEEAIFPVDFSFGDTVSVELSFDHDAGLASVTVGGNSITSTSLDIGQYLDAFALRQSDSSNNENITVDNLVVSHIPEPATLALMLFGLAGIGASRRRG